MLTNIIAFVSNPYPFYLVFYEVVPDDETRNYWKVSCISNIHKKYMDEEYSTDPSFEPFSYCTHDFDMSFPCCYTAEQVFKGILAAYGIKSVQVSNAYLKWIEDCRKHLEESEAAYDRQEEHYNAYMLYEHTGDRSLLDRYERRIEQEDS